MEVDRQCNGAEEAFFFNSFISNQNDSDSIS
jgi:hypothetical protein